MTTLVLDSGAFIGVENNDRRVLSGVQRARDLRWGVRTTGGVVAEVWRPGNGRQAPLAALLKGVEIMAVDDELGRVAGQFLAVSALGDAVDATVVAVARADDTILTSDEKEIAALVAASGRHIDVARC